MTPTRPADAVIFVLLDAFRHDYLGRTRFLKDLSARSLVGQLEEPFGFCPRGAYFGGLSMAEQGFTHLFRYDPDRSCFRWTRDVSGTGDDASVGAALLPGIRRRAQQQLPAFASAVHPWGIPLEWQRYFDFSEREAPWSPRAGYRSLFHMLDEASMPWLEASWPFTGLGDIATDGTVAGDALRRLSHAHRFAFIHLPSLDSIGHQYGPGSVEVQRGLNEVDRLAELIYNRAEQLFDRPAFIFAGDHGMLPVVRHADPAAALAATGLRFGHDFAFFIDSTAVRCWFFTEAARRHTLDALRVMGGGRWIDEADKRRWEIDGIDRRNGEAYFLADPGVLFSPSFFDWTGQHAPKGMHGYAPDVADNRALFLAHAPRQRTAANAGVVHARQLFPTLLQMLGWNPADHTAVAPAHDTGMAQARTRWFVSAPQTADAIVDTHLSSAVTAIRASARSTTAVVVTGGFGRGEGTPARDGASVRPANDYDILVVGAQGAELAGLGDRLASDFGMDFVDIFGGPSLTPGAVTRLSDFDLRYGGRVLWGDPAIVERIGSPAPAELDLVEAAFLVGNRTGGMLLGWTGQTAVPGDERAFLSRQTSKFLIAIADAWLISIGDYTVSYGARQRRFHDLGTAAGFSGATMAAIDAAFSAKLGTCDGALPTSPSIIVAASNELDRILPLDDLLPHAALRHLPSRDTAEAAAVYLEMRDLLRAWPERHAGIAGAAAVLSRRWLAFSH